MHPPVGSTTTSSLKTLELFVTQTGALRISLSGCWAITDQGSTNRVDCSLHICVVECGGGRSSSDRYCIAGTRKIMQLVEHRKHPSSASRRALQCAVSLHTAPIGALHGAGTRSNACHPSPSHHTTMSFPRTVTVMWSVSSWVCSHSSGYHCRRQSNSAPSVCHSIR
jgi:hypothetical protein